MPHPDHACTCYCPPGAVVLKHGSTCPARQPDHDCFACRYSLRLPCVRDLGMFPALTWYLRHGITE